MIPGMNKSFETAISTEIYGAFLSRSGLTIAAFCNGENALNVQKAMVKRCEEESISVKLHILDFDTKKEVGGVGI
jgi:homoserine kinase